MGGTSHLHFFGREKTPVVVLDKVLSDSAFASAERDLRRREKDFVEDHKSNVSFPGKIAPLDWTVVGSLVDALLEDDKVPVAFPSTMFKQRDLHDAKLPIW